MTYEEFKYKEDKRWALERVKLNKRADIAYNKGLWDSVKFNPFRWHVYLLLKRL